MIEISALVKSLPGYPLAEIPGIKRRLIESGMDVIDLGAGDNDTPPPAIAVDAMTEALADPAYSKYGFQQGLPAFRQAASRWVEQRFGKRFDPVTEILPLIGSKDGLAHLPFAVVNPGDVTIVPEPGYQAYLGGSLLAGAEPLRGPAPPGAELPAGAGEDPAGACCSGPSWRSSTIPTTRPAPSPPLSTWSARRGLPPSRHPPGLRQRLLRSHLRRVPGAQHLRDPGRVGRRAGVLLALQELLDDRLAARIRRRTGGADRRADPGEVLRGHGAVSRGAAGRCGGARPGRGSGRADPRGAEAAEGCGGAGAPRAPVSPWSRPRPRCICGSRSPPDSLPPRSRAGRWRRPARWSCPGSAFGPAGEGYFRIALIAGPDRLTEAAERLGRFLEATRREELATTA